MSMCHSFFSFKMIALQTAIRQVGLLYITANKKTPSAAHENYG